MRKEQSGVTPRSREPGLIDLPDRSDLRPHRRDRDASRGPLGYVNPSMQVMNFGAKKAGTSPASASFVQSTPTGLAKARRDDTLNVTPGISRDEQGKRAAKEIE